MQRRGNELQQELAELRQQQHQAARIELPAPADAAPQPDVVASARRWQRRDAETEPQRDVSYELDRLAAVQFWLRRHFDSEKVEWTAAKREVPNGHQRECSHSLSLQLTLSRARAMDLLSEPPRRQRQDRC
eukprot:Skav233087  [mRNA]  locus=scaffold1963:40230:42124:- [translate_table: standard]